MGNFQGSLKRIILSKTWTYLQTLRTLEISKDDKLECLKDIIVLQKLKLKIDHGKFPRVAEEYYIVKDLDLFANL